MVEYCTDRYNRRQMPDQIDIPEAFLGPGVVSDQRGVFAGGSGAGASGAGGANER
jgi:hypothetical protein